MENEGVSESEDAGEIVDKDEDEGESETESESENADEC